MRGLLALVAGTAAVVAPVAVAQVQPPPGAVATVGDSVISKGTFDAWSVSPKTRKRDVMSFLIQSEWVHGEARLRGIEVTQRDVRTFFRRQKRLAFKNERQYRRYLRGSGFTQRQILFRAEVDLLKERLDRAALATAGPVTRADVRRYIRSHPRALRGLSRADRRDRARNVLTDKRQDAALSAFVRDVRRRWRAVTLCARGYVVAECRNAPR